MAVAGPLQRYTLDQNTENELLWGAQQHCAPLQYNANISDSENIREEGAKKL